VGEQNVSVTVPPWAVTVAFARGFADVGPVLASRRQQLARNRVSVSGGRQAFITPSRILF
jgi:hypothetical protein